MTTKKYSHSEPIRRVPIKCKVAGVKSIGEIIREMINTGELSRSKVIN